MSVGYPDYTRLSREGGYLLYGSASGVPENTHLFRGYVGLWPYINLMTNCNVSTEAARIEMIYCSDNTFSDIVAFRYAIRQSTNFAITQYANLTDWLDVLYVTDSGNDFPFTNFALYATSGQAGQVQLSSLDVPIFQFNQSVAAATTVSVNVTHIQPGAADFIIFSNAASWSISVNYWNYDAAAYQTYADFNQNINPTGGTFSLAMPDAPCQIHIRNNDATAQVIAVGWASR